MNGQTRYVIGVLLFAAVVSALLIGVPVSFLTALAALACLLVYRIVYRPSSARREELDRVVRGKSPSDHIVSTSGSSPSYFKPILFLVALGVSFFAGAVWQRANDEREMQQMLQVHRILKATLPTEEQIDAKLAAESERLRD